MDEILLIGGGGHCRSVIDVIEQEGRFRVIGIVDNNLKKGTTILGYPVVGKDSDLEDLRKTCKYALITVGQIKSSGVRVKLFNLLKELNFILPIIVSPTAYISKHASLAEGTVVMHNVVVNSGCKIGSNCIINTKALLEHDVVVGNHVHVSTASVVNGGCAIGDRVFIGSGSVIANSLSIGNDVIIGAGAVVVSSILESGVYVGCPARKVK